MSDAENGDSQSKSPFAFELETYFILSFPVVSHEIITGVQTETNLSDWTNWKKDLAI